MSEIDTAHAAVASARGPAVHRERMLAFMDEHLDALLRSCVTGHLTASAAVVDSAGRHVLLLHHRKLDRWLQPGGHADGDGDLAAVAAKEVWEETGLRGTVDRPAIDLDVHVIPARHGEPEHVHLDVRFRITIPTGAVAVGNDESHALRWVGLDDLADPGLALDDGTERLIRTALARAPGG